MVANTQYIQVKHKKSDDPKAIPLVHYTISIENIPIILFIPWVTV